MCSSHGKCVCGKCQCEPNWSGEDCSCHMVTDKCMGPYSPKECSGQGKCTCNKCVCDSSAKSEGQFAGEFCEKHPNEGLPCAILAPHVECRAFPQEPPQPNKECGVTLDFELIEVNSTDPVVDKQANCRAFNKKGCSFM